jgi:hypothetical protein
MYIRRQGSTLCLMLVALFAVATARGQVSHCGGFTSIREMKSPIYPPIAKAAQVEGDVIMMLVLDLSGNVESIETMSGPKMLIPPAIEAIKQLKANPYSGPRTCSFVVTFRLARDGEEVEHPPRPSDLQHVHVFAIRPPVYSDHNYVLPGR